MSQYTHKVKYTSDYLIPEVSVPEGLGFHQITLTWDRGRPEVGTGIRFDPNTCALDEFGKPTICTKIALPESDVKLTLFKQKPGHQAYTIESRPRSGGSSFAVLPLRLVIVAARGKEPAKVHLLVLSPEQTIERIIDLHEDHRA